MSQANPKQAKTKQALQKNIHWYKEAKVTCVCGNSFVTGSTLAEIKVDICSACHPFYTGKQKLVDVEGRVERFNKRYANLKKKPKK